MALFGKADADLPLLTHLAQLDLDDRAEVEAFISRWPTFHKIYVGGQEAARRIAQRKAAEAAREANGEIQKLEEAAELIRSFYTDETPRGFFVNTALNAIEQLRTQSTAAARFEKEMEDFEQGRRQTQPNLDHIANHQVSWRVREAFTSGNAELMMSRFLAVSRLAVSVATNLCDHNAIAEADITQFEILREQYQPMYALLPQAEEDASAVREAADDLRPISHLALVIPVPAANSSAIVQVLFGVQEMLRDAIQGKVNLSRCEVCSHVYAVTTVKRQRFCSHRCGDRIYRRRKRTEEAEEQEAFKRGALSNQNGRFRVE